MQLKKSKKCISNCDTKGCRLVGVDGYDREMTAFDVAAGRVARGADARAEARGLVAQMTLGEKLGCLDGDLPFWPGLADLAGGGYNSHPWPAASVERLGIPGLAFADGPRGCVMGPSTTFPVSMARGASFDPGLEERIGEAIGAELRAGGATFTGAVCMNLLRHPGWGRAQETYGEDPCHVGEMAAALTRGLQHHVMACMKHFACNSMENSRFKVDIVASERALHEVYLPHFKRVASEGAASAMSAYNAVNGRWCGDSGPLLNGVLRDDWGWEGFVVTDFIVGIYDPVESVRAGCNVELPFRQQRAQALPDAVAAGELDVADVDARVVETVGTFLRFAHVYRDRPDRSVLACAEHRALAREAATASMVLLRNDGCLPIDAAGLGRVAVLGELAAVANLGDGGSSNILHTPEPVTLLAGIEAALAGRGVPVVHSRRDAAVAAGADVAIVVVGYTAQDEGEYLGDTGGDRFVTMAPRMDHPELGLTDADQGAALAGFELAVSAAGGGDRASLRLRPDDEKLIADTAAACDRVVVAVMAGSAVVMPWLESVNAALMVWYPGSEGGRALADVLLGDAEPGGRLPFAVPRDESDLVDFDLDATSAVYGLLHGQWHLDASGTEAHLPFGHGLGYSTLGLGDARLDGDHLAVEVANTGPRRGSTVVQAYASVPGSAHQRPPKRLVGFSKVSLDAGERTEARIALDRSQLDLRLDGAWVTEDLPVEFTVGLDASNPRPV